MHIRHKWNVFLKDRSLINRITRVFHSLFHYLEKPTFLNLLATKDLPLHKWKCCSGYKGCMFGLHIGVDSSDRAHLLLTPGTNLGSAPAARAGWSALILHYLVVRETRDAAICHSRACRRSPPACRVATTIMFTGQMKMKRTSDKTGLYCTELEHVTYYREELGEILHTKTGRVQSKMQLFVQKKIYTVSIYMRKKLYFSGVKL